MAQAFLNTLVLAVVSENFHNHNLCHVLATFMQAPETAGFRLKDFVLAHFCNSLCFAQFLIMLPLTLLYPHGYTATPMAADCTLHFLLRLGHTPHTTHHVSSGWGVGGEWGQTLSAHNRMEQAAHACMRGK